MGQLQKPSSKRRKPIAELVVIERQPPPSPSPPEDQDTDSSNESAQLGRDDTTRQAHDAIVKQLAEQLGETEVQSLRQLHSIVKHLGPEQALGFLQETLSIEQNGGLMLADGSRRRTPGGVFFYLVRTKGPKEVKRLFYNQRPRKAQPTGENHTPAAITGADTQPQTPFTWEDRIAALDEISTEKGIVSTVKIILVGRPGKIVDRGTCIVTAMKAKQALPTLPKGLPTPAAYQTNYVVYIATKQWRKVAEAIQDPEDILIVEGYPQLDPETSSIAVFATNVTTKNLQRAVREAQKEVAQ